MNSKSFQPDPFKPTNSRRNCDKKKEKKEDEHIIGAIIEMTTNYSAPVELDLTEEEVPDSNIEVSESDREELIGGDLDTSSKLKIKVKKTMLNHTSLFVKKQ